MAYNWRTRSFPVFLLDNKLPAISIILYTKFIGHYNVLKFTTFRKEKMDRPIGSKQLVNGVRLVLELALSKAHNIYECSSLKASFLSLMTHRLCI